MDIQEIQTLIAKGESETVEFKKTTSKLQNAFKTICGFLNGSGGALIIGVSDDGKIVGQEISDSTKREIAQKLNQIEPAPKINIAYVNVSLDKYVILISTLAGEHLPYTFDARPYQRCQSTTERMSQHKYEQLIVERGYLDFSWEESLCEEDLEPLLDENEIHHAVSVAVSNRRIPASALGSNIEDILKRFNLTRKGKLKRAAIVLFAKKPELLFPQCVMKMARFNGTNKQGDFADSQQVYGNVFHLLNEADTFLARQLPLVSIFDANSFKRVDKPALPLLAIREALINAICHRDYNDRSGSIVTLRQHCVTFKRRSA